MKIKIVEDNTPFGITSVGSNGKKAIRIDAQNNDIIKVTLSFDIVGSSGKGCLYTTEAKALRGSIERLTDSKSNSSENNDGWTRASRIDYFRCTDDGGIFDFSVRFEALRGSPEMTRFQLIGENLGNAEIL